MSLRTHAGPPGRPRRRADRGQVHERQLLLRSLSPEPDSVAEARAATESSCRAGCLATAREAAVLVVSELVGNAVRHGASSAVALRLSMTPRRLRIEVADDSRGQPSLHRPGPLSEGGRGLLLVEAVSTRWGTARDPLGKQVWAEIALPEA